MKSLSLKKSLWILAVFILAATALIICLFFGCFQHKKHPNQCSIGFLPYNNKYFIEAEINKNKSLFLLDTGSFCFLSLYKDSLDAIPNKQEIGEQKWLDVNGNKYNSKVFELDSIKFENFEVENITAKAENYYARMEGSRLCPDISPSKATIKEKKKLSGSVGIKLFRSHNYWYVDLPNRLFFPIESREEKENFLEISKQNLLEIPIEENESHVVFSIETDFGIKRFCLDTGSNRTIIKSVDSKGPFSSRQFAKTKKFIANRHDFGEIEIYFFDFQIDDFDGFLGVDFLGEHPFLLDFENNKIFIQKDPLKKFIFLNTLIKNLRFFF